MSKPSTKKSTTTTKPATTVKRAPRRPRKTAAKVTKPRQTKARILQAGDVAIKSPSAGSKAAPLEDVPVTKGDLKEAYKPFKKSTAELERVVTRSKPAKPAPKRPLGSPAKPAVNVAQIEKSLKEAMAAKAAKEKRVTELEIELFDTKEENRRLQRTVKRLQEVIAELKAKEANRGWLRRFIGGRS